MVSEAKCNIYFSPNVNVEMKAQICTNLNIMTLAISDIYLGLTTMVGLDRSENFIDLLERIIEKTQRMETKKFVYGGKGDPIESYYPVHSSFLLWVFSKYQKVYVRRHKRLEESAHGGKFVFQRTWGCGFP
jgi:hypothetical protein